MGAASSGERETIMGYANYVCRVGALAVALGVGAAMAGTPGIGYATTGTAGSSTDSSSTTSESTSDGSASPSGGTTVADATAPNEASVSGNSPSTTVQDDTGSPTVTVGTSGHASRPAATAAVDDLDSSDILGDVQTGVQQQLPTGGGQDSDSAGTDDDGVLATVPTTPEPSAPVANSAPTQADIPSAGSGSARAADPAPAVVTAGERAKTEEIQPGSESTEELPGAAAVSPLVSSQPLAAASATRTSSVANSDTSSATVQSAGEGPLGPLSDVAAAVFTVASSLVNAAL